MSGRELHGQGLFYEDVDEGDWFQTASLQVTARLVDDFAALTGDKFEIHLSDAAARRHGFPSRVAHGLLVLSLVDGLKNQAETQFAAVASLGWTWRFDRPVLVGDAIRARLTVVGKRPTQKPERGVLQLRLAVANGEGAIAQSGENALMVYRRTPAVSEQGSP